MPKTLKVLLVSFSCGSLLMLVLGGILGLILYFTDVSATLTPLFTLGVLIFSVFMSGFGAACKIGSRGILIGIEIALIFILAIFLISLFVDSGSIVWGFAWLKFLFIGLAGIMGGMSGVAFSQKIV